MKEFKSKYIYLHKNGEFIEKPEIVVDMGGGGHEYFQGDMVVDWWFVQTQEQLNKIIQKTPND